VLTETDTEALIRRLQAFALGDAPGSLTDAEVAAGLALLDRVMPSQVEIILTTTEDRHISARVTPE
jgi:hypothetical protein